MIGPGKFCYVETSEDESNQEEPQQRTELDNEQEENSQSWF